MTEANPLEEFVLRYKDDPVLFVKEVLGATPYDYQAEFLDALASGERKMSVRSGHGTGKSTTVPVTCCSPVLPSGSSTIIVKSIVLAPPLTVLVGISH